MLIRDGKSIRLYFDGHMAQIVSEVYLLQFDPEILILALLLLNL